MSDLTVTVAGYSTGSRIAGMKTVPAKLKLILYAWVRQPKDEMDRRQDRNEIQPLHTLSTCRSRLQRSMAACRLERAALPEPFKQEGHFD